MTLLKGKNGVEGMNKEGGGRGEVEGCGGEGESREFNASRTHTFQNKKEDNPFNHIRSHEEKKKKKKKRKNGKPGVLGRG